MARTYKCPYCEKRFERPKLINHIDRVHSEMIPEGFTSTRVVFNMINKTEGGKCRVCGKPTPWNEKIGRYDVLCNNPKCKQELRERYKKNMLRVRGTYNILNDPEQQKIMLANRRISGKYKHSDGGILEFTGTYERQFLEFIDNYLEIPSKDIISPGPTMQYIYNGEKHIYIPDFYIPSINCIIEIKDGGDNKNNRQSASMTASREKTIEKERVVTDQGIYNYLRLSNNQFEELIDFFMEIKQKMLNSDDSKTVKIYESYFSDGDKAVAEAINESTVLETALSHYNKEKITDDVISRYDKPLIHLNRIRTGENNTGYLFTDHSIPVALISVEKKDNGERWIQALEVSKEYQHQGLGTQLLKFAEKNLNAEYLSVNKKNKVAINMYEKNGWKTYDSTEAVYFMKK